MSRVPSPDSTAWAIYQKHIFQLGFGLPFWNPQPMPGRLPITHGAVVHPAVMGDYMVLFHTMQQTPQDDVPEGFEPLELPSKSNSVIYGPRDTVKNPFHVSKSVTSKEVKAEADIR